VLGKKERRGTKEKKNMMRQKCGDDGSRKKGGNNQ
jgi:hypothetical protein